MECFGCFDVTCCSLSIFGISTVNDVSSHLTYSLRDHALPLQLSFALARNVCMNARRFENTHTLMN